jgi:hypothetical protein
MIIKSKYDSMCRECGEAVYRGYRVNWTRGVKGVECLDCYHADTPPVDDSPQTDGWAMLIGRDRALQTFGPLTSEHQGELWRIITDWGYKAHQAPQALPVATPPAIKAPVATPPAIKAPVATPPAIKAPVATPPAAKAPENATSLDDGMSRLLDMMKAETKS